MTKREEERLNALLLKKEAEEKADREFFAQVRRRKAEVLKYLGVNSYESELDILAHAYGCTIDELLKYIATQRQVDYYKRTHIKDKPQT